MAAAKPVQCFVIPLQEPRMTSGSRRPVSRTSGQRDAVHSDLVEHAQGTEVEPGHGGVACHHRAPSPVGRGEERDQRELDERDEEGIELDRPARWRGRGRAAAAAARLGKNTKRVIVSPRSRSRNSMHHQRIIHQKRASTPAKK